jgi:hypothetical protein
MGLFAVFAGILGKHFARETAILEGSLAAPDSARLGTPGCHGKTFGNPPNSIRLSARLVHCLLSDLAASSIRPVQTTFWHYLAFARSVIIMGMFSNLMSKIFGHPAATSTTSPASVTPATASSGSAPATAAPTTAAFKTAASSAAAPAAAPEAKSSPPAVDVNAVLNDLAAKSSEKLDWKTSIVDLLKLVGMDSSLAARKELAVELHYPGDQSDSAKMNVWLHKQVLIKLAENGGKVPQELLG